MKPVLLCLHGWGGSKESFTELRAALAGMDIEILTPDLPGFGNEPEPPRPWSVDDYADWVEEWLRKKLPAINQQPANQPTSQRARVLHVLGHSHGGRIAIVLASRQPATSNEPTSNVRFAHLSLCAAAGIRRGQYLKRATGFLIAKTGKLLLRLPLMLNHIEPVARRLLYRLLRTHDYEKAGPLMRQTMARVTAENLRPLLKHITIPTDIFWGTDDRITPYRDALIAHREISGSTLHTYPGVRHSVHRDRAREIAEVIRRQLHA